MKVSLNVLALIIITGLLSLVDLPTLVKKKQRKELFLLVSLFCIGFILNFLLIIGTTLPDPNKLIVSLLNALMK